MSRRFRLLPCALLLSVLVLVAPARGQAPPDGDFQVTTLAKGADKTGEPIAMAVLPDRSVLHTSRDGRVWRTTANATTRPSRAPSVRTNEPIGASRQTATRAMSVR